MAHELDFTLGRAAIAITHDGQVPWHGFGERVAPDGDLDQWRIAAGLNWEVREQKGFYAVGDPATGKGKPTEIPNLKVLVRSDNQEVLSTVSNRYQVVQPAHLVEFYRDLVNAHGFKMNTMGALMEGRKIWALASIGQTVRIMGQDQVDGYLLMSTSYDGSSATLVKPTSVRVVCNNTLQFALGDGIGQISVPHSTSFDEQEIKARLGLVEGGWHRFEDEANLLAERPVEPEEALNFFRLVLGKDAVTVDEHGKVTYTQTFAKMYSLYEHGRGQNLRAARHTAWGLVNAVTEFQDHVVGARNAGNRFTSATFGAGAQRKASAWTAACELAGLRAAA